MLHNMIPKKSKYCKKLQNNKSRRKNFLHLFKLQSSTHRLWRWWRYPWSAFYDDSSFLNMRHCDIMSIHACMKRFKIFDEIHFSGFPCSSMQRTSRQTSKRQDLLWPSLSCRLVIIIIESSSSASASDENPLLINMFGTMLYHYPHHNLNFHNIFTIWPGKDQRVNFQKCFRRNHFWQSFSAGCCSCCCSPTLTCYMRKMVRTKIETILHRPLMKYWDGPSRPQLNCKIRKSTISPCSSSAERLRLTN